MQCVRTPLLSEICSASADTCLRIVRDLILRLLSTLTSSDTPNLFCFFGPRLGMLLSQGLWRVFFLCWSWPARAGFFVSSF